MNHASAGARREPAPFGPVRAAMIDLLLAWRGLFRQPTKSVLAGLGIGGGVVALVLAGGFVEWNFWNYRESTISSRLGHIQVHKAGFRNSGTANPFAYLLGEDAPELGEIRRLPGVRTVAPRLNLTGLVSFGDATLSFLGDGVDPDAEAALGRGFDIREGTGLSAQDPRGVLIGEGLAANLGVRVGEKVILLANTPSGGVNAVEGTVRGIFATISKAYDDAAVRIPRGLAQELLRVAGAHAWVVLLERTELTDAVSVELDARYGASGLEFARWIDSADFYRKSRDLYSKQVVVMKLIIAAIIVLSISNARMMSVVERTGEIGTAMALGDSRATILRRYFAEGLVLGLVAAVAGLVLGLGLAALISWVGIPIPPPPGMARGYDGEIMVTLPIAIDAVLVAWVTTCLASVYPAWKASRMTVVDALRFNR